MLPDPPRPETTVFDYLRLLRRRIRLILGVTALFALGGLVIGILDQRDYESEAAISVEPVGGETDFGSVPDPVSVATDAALRLASTAVREAEAGLTARQVMKQVTVERIPDSTLLRVAVAGSTRRESTRLTQAYTRALVAELRARARAPLARTLRRVVEDRASVEVRLRRSGGRRLLERAASLESDERRLRSRIARLDSGLTIAQPVGPAPQTRSGLVHRSLVGMVLGAFLGLGLALVTDFLDQRPRSGAHLAHRFGVPYLGHIGGGFEPTRPNASAHDVRALLSTPSRGDRSYVLAAVPLHPEALAGTAGMQLASSFAIGGQSVVVIDLDLARGTVGQVIGASDARGTAEALVWAGVEPDMQTVELSTESGVSEVAVVTAGARVADPGSLLAGSRVASLLDGLRAGFDMVIAVCAPYSTSGTVRPVLKHADTLLLFADLARVDLGAMGAVADELRRLDVPVAGLVTIEGDRAPSGSGVPSRNPQPAGAQLSQ